MKLLKRILAALLLVGLLAIGGGYIYLFPMKGIETQISHKLTGLAGQYGARVTIGDIEGDLLNGLAIRNVWIVAEDSSGNRLADVRLKSLTAHYSLYDIYAGQYDFEYIGIESLSVRIAVDSHYLPLLKKKGVQSAEDGTGAKGLNIPPITIDQLALAGSDLTLISPTDSLVISNLTLGAAVQADQDLVAADVRVLRFDGNRVGWELNRLSGKLTYALGNLVAQGLAVEYRDSRIRLDGVARFDSRLISGDFDVSNFDLVYLEPFVKTKVDGLVDVQGRLTLDSLGLRGSASIRGELEIMTFENLYTSFRLANRTLYLDTLSGLILESCAITGSGQIAFGPPEDTYKLDCRIQNFDLSRLVKGTFASDLNGMITLDGCSFRTRTLALMLDTKLYESRFDRYPIQSAAGQLLITADSIRFEDGFDLTYYENDFRVAGVIDYSDSLDLAVTGELGDIGRFRQSFFIKEPGGTGKGTARFTGRTNNPNLSGTLLSDSLWLYGLFSRQCTLTVDVDQMLADQQGDVMFHSSSGTAWGEPYDSLRTTLRIQDGAAIIDTSLMYAPRGELAAVGRLQYDQYPLELRLDSLKIHTLDRSLTNLSPCIAQVDSAGWRLVTVEMGAPGAEASFSGRLNYDRTLDLNIATTRVRLSDWAGLVSENVPLDGLAVAGAWLGGTLEAPLIDLEAAIDSLTWQGVPLGRLLLHAGYEQKQLRLDSMLLLGEGTRYHATGTAGLDLAVSSTRFGRMIDQPIDVTITALDTVLDIVPLTLPAFEEMNGRLSTRFRLTGTPSQPHLEGQALLTNASLKYLELAGLLYVDSATATLTDNRIDLDQIEAYVLDRRRGSRRAYAYLDGSVTFRSLDTLEYDVSVSLPNEFPYRYDLDDIEGKIAGELRIQGYAPPLVTGDITVLSTQYLVNFAESYQGTPFMALLAPGKAWDININADILSNYWIKNDDIDAEFTGQLNIIREQGEWRYIGEMEILRGKGFILDKTFRLEEGSRVLFDNTKQLNPTLDITGCTRIGYSTRPDDESREPIELCIQIGGTLENPEFNTTPDSPYPREDIIPLLVANTAAGDTLQAGGNQIQERLTGLISSQVSQIGSRNLGRLGVETFEIDPLLRNGQLDPQGSRLTIGFYTGPGIYLYGRSTLGARGQEVGFEYRFGRAVRLSGRRDEDELYHLGLRLHFEY